MCTQQLLTHHTHMPLCITPALMLQGKSTAKQAHAELKRQYESDHMSASKDLPYPDLMQIPVQVRMCHTIFGQQSVWW